MAQMAQMEGDEAVLLALPAESPKSDWPANDKEPRAVPPICGIGEIRGQFH